jgi:hypothetical protein
VPRTLVRALLVALILLGAVVGGAVSPRDVHAASPSPSPSPTASAGPTAPTLADTDPTKVVTFGVQPSFVKGYDNRSFFSWVATPGGVLKDTAVALNFSYKPITLTVGVTDATNTDTGGFALLADNEKPKDAGSWIHLDPKYRSVVVPARTANAAGRAAIPLTVDIPATASPGDHVGGITVSLISTAKSPSGQSYRLVQRVGSRIFIRVSGPVRPELTIEQLSATYHGNLSPRFKGTATVTYVVHNTGNVSLGGTQVVTVKGLFGSSVTAANVPPIPLLLPGSSLAITVDVDGVWPAFRDTAQVQISPLAVPGAQMPAAGPWTAETSFWAIPWLLVLILVLLLLVFVIYRWMLRRHRRGPGRPDGDLEADAPKPGPTEDTLEDVRT